MEIVTLCFNGEKLKQIKWCDIYNTDKYSVKMVLINSFSAYELEKLSQRTKYDAIGFMDHIGELIEICPS